ncbi:MAG TPA: hypothetical protein VGU74_09410 [Gemmatimonadales bacterium]|nr:hypothetical protein [Gemmatimonadales bacterium]
MTRYTSARLHVGTLVRAVVPTCIFLAFGCGASRVPPTLRGYDILVQGQDSQSVELARAMKGLGYHVRQNVKGGSRPTAALIHFLYAEPGPVQSTWFHLRLADTRSGVIVGVASIQLDSALNTPRARAVAAVQSISAP